MHTHEQEVERETKVKYNKKNSLSNVLIQMLFDFSVRLLCMSVYLAGSTTDYVVHCEILSDWLCRLEILDGVVLEFVFG